MKIYISFLFVALMLSCSDDQSSQEENYTEQSTDETESLEVMAKRHVEANLQIPATEKYTMEIHRRKLNEDQFEDAIILVNRKEFAMLEAERAPNTPQRAETGFMGKYNFVFYFDGAKNQITRPIPIASSALLPLRVEFKSVYSEGYEDFIVEHRIRDAAFKSFFTVKSNTPFMVFQWKIHDYLNTPNQEVIYLGFGEGSRTLAKDILVFEGKIEGKIPGIFEPMEAKIVSTGRLKYRFFYDPKQGKYATTDKPE